MNVHVISTHELQAGRAAKRQVYNQ